MKRDVEDFWSIINKDELWTDNDFKATNEQALIWKDMGESSADWDAITINWKRASTDFSDHSLFGEGISVDDIYQGYIGNCWFMTAVAAAAEK